jgi:hypothetical protein
MTRLIFTESRGLQDEIKGLLSSCLIAGVLSPSRRLWLTSPWVSDIAVIDNRNDAYREIAGEWPPRDIGLARSLVSLAERGTEVCLLTRPDPHNLRFIQELQHLAIRAGARGKVACKVGEVLHEKGLLADDWYLSGSMNFTMNGIRVLDEALRFDTEPQIIAEAKIAFSSRWASSEYTALGGWGDAR